MSENQKPDREPDAPVRPKRRTGRKALRVARLKLLNWLPNSVFAVFAQTACPGRWRYISTGVPGVKRSRLPPSAFAGDGRERPASYGVSPRQRLRRGGEKAGVCCD